MNIFKKIKENIFNSVELPQSYRFFVRHIQEGIVSYENGRKDRLIYLSNTVLNEMDKTFTGKPIYINHIDTETATEDEAKAQHGVVVKSFYNPSDGWHWAEIMVDETGAGVLRKGWKVSNAHRVTQMKGEGFKNNTHFDNEVLMSEYEHLALTPSPRYEESIVMTPDEFSTYNEKKIEEIEKLKNSNEDEEMKKANILSALTSLANAIEDVKKELNNEEEDKKEVEVKEEKEEKKNEAVEEKTDNETEEKEEKVEEVKETKEENENDARAALREIAEIIGKPDEDFEGGEAEKIKQVLELAKRLVGKEENACGVEAKKNEEEVKKEEVKEEVKKEDNEVEDMQNSVESQKHFSDLHNAKARKSEAKVVSTDLTGIALGKQRYGSNK